MVTTHLEEFAPSHVLVCHKRDFGVTSHSHVVAVTREVNFERSAPWFTQELRQMKTEGRILERRCKQTGLTVHNLAFRDHQKAYLKSLKVNNLLKPKSSLSTETTVERCNSFIYFFRSKVNNIRSSISGSPSLSPPSSNPLSDHQATYFFRSRPLDFVLWGTELSVQLHHGFGTTSRVS
ncbi:unnamed protein product [Leuciscus chuanchicus]